MRIAGGTYSGRLIQAPKGPGIRPTLDQVRQALFNLLGERVAGAKVLDLFSGSGALGIEALSRGAAHVTFVDRSGFCVRAIAENLKSIGVEPSRCQVIRSEAVAAIRRLEGRSFDGVLLDPPYGADLAIKSLNALSRYAIVASSGWVVAEHDKRDSLPPLTEGKEARLVLQRQERYGDTVLSIYEKSPHTGHLSGDV